MRAFDIALFSSLFFFNVACDEDDGGEGDSTNQPSGDGDGDSADDGDGDSSGDGDSAGDGDGDSNAGEQEDPFCQYAWDGFTALDAHIELMNELGLSGDLPVSFINENGTLALEQSDVVQESFEEARDFVVDDDAHLAFELILVYEETWLRPHAALAAEAGSQDEFDQGAFNLIMQDGVAEAISDGAVESGVAAQYTLGRCGSVYGPGQ